MSMNYEPGIFPYIIQDGDTFADIADDYGATIDEILDANPEVDPDNLLFGQVIWVPGAPPSAFPLDDQAELVESQQRRRPERRRPQYRPPVFRPRTCPGGRLYAVRVGDNVYRIARRFGVSVRAIVARNPYLSVNFLRVGQVICVPFR